MPGLMSRRAMASVSELYFGKTALLSTMIIFSGSVCFLADQSRHFNLR